MTSLRHVAFAAAAVLLAGVTAACGTEGTGSKGYVDSNRIVEIKPADRKPVGTIAGETLDGERLTLSSYAAGRPAVVNAWGSWCAPCRKEAPLLVDASKTLGDKAAFVGVNIRDYGAQDQARAFERNFSVPYPSLYDPTGRSLLGLPGRGASINIPSTVVIDSKGRMAALVLGDVPSARTVVDLVQDAG